MPNHQNGFQLLQHAPLFQPLQHGFHLIWHPHLFRWRLEDIDQLTMDIETMSSLLS